MAHVTTGNTPTSPEPDLTAFPVLPHGLVFSKIGQQTHMLSHHEGRFILATGRKPRSSTTIVYGRASRPIEVDEGDFVRRIIISFFEDDAPLATGTVAADDVILASQADVPNTHIAHGVDNETDLPTLTITLYVCDTCAAVEPPARKEAEPAT